MTESLQAKMAGTILHGDEISVIADTPQEAIEALNEHYGTEDPEDPEHISWVHCWVGVPVEITEENYDDLDWAPDGFDVGDTVYRPVGGPRRHPRDLRDGEVLAWTSGPWSPHWQIAGPGHHPQGKWAVEVDRQSLGAFATEAEARSARDAEVDRLVLNWKQEVTAA